MALITMVILPADSISATMWFTTLVRGTCFIASTSLTNTGNRVTDGGAHEVNFVGNYYKPGPASELTYDLQATVSILLYTMDEACEADYQIV